MVTFLSRLLIVFALCTGALHASSPEFRGAWVASVYNIDWPSKPGLSAEAQQAEMRRMLDRAASLKLNAILLQVRAESDALYNSRAEPWSRYLTGKQGGDPGYDPLAFAVREAHARGIQVHAWFNPFRASVNSKNALAPNHVARRKPEWIRRFGNHLWVDPGVPEARAYVIGIMVDVARRYQIDGVHIDDYFYPYPQGKLTFPDQNTALRYKAQGQSLGDWRRQNINTFVRDMQRELKAVRPSLKIGISPFGIWRPGIPATTEAGIDAYGQLFADSRKWLENGWCDYLAPQLYWSISPRKQSFPVLLDWWREQSRGAAVWPGIASDRIGAKRPAQEIINQIEISRKGRIPGGAPGHIHWSMKALMDNKGGIADKLRSGPYRERASVPATRQ